MPEAGRAASRRPGPGTPTVAAVRTRAASVSAGLATRPVQGGRPTPYAVAVIVEPLAACWASSETTPQNSS